MMKPGIHRNVTNEAYHAGPGISKSGLWAIHQTSPAHWKFMREHPKPPTPAMAFGSAVHALVLEPETFEERYAPAPIGQSKAAKERRLELECSGFTLVQTTDGKAGMWDRDDWRTAHAIADTVSAHPTASALLAHGESEVSVFWEQDVDGVPVLCKCRPDSLDRTAHNIAIDLKTCASAAEDDLSRAVQRYGYHVQAAWYLDGLAAAGVAVDAFVFIFVESSPPHGIRVYELEPPAVEQGRVVYRGILRRYAECLATDTWPGYDTGVSTLSFPYWFYK
jgi:hypothetical protein